MDTKASSSRDNVLVENAQSTDNVIHDEEEHDDRKSGCCGKSKMTPIPWSILLLVFFPLFSSCYSITYIFPYIPAMVLYFGHREEDKGYYAGIIASAFFLGRILGSYFWGWLSDRKGRKPVLIICLVMVCVTNLLFGFMPNVWSASAMRLLVGLFNGLMPVVKSIIYEVSDDTNHSWCMSVISVGWGAGSVIGPLVSGFLAEPVSKYPDTFSDTGVFAKFPFLFPSIVAMGVCLVSAIPVIFKMPETSVRKTYRVQRVLDDKEIKNEPAAEEQDALILERNHTPVAVAAKRDPKQRHSLMLLPVRENSPNSKDSDQGTDELSPLPWPESNDICFIDSGKTDEYSQVYGYGFIPESSSSLCNLDLYPSLTGNKRRSWRLSLTRSRSRSLRSLQQSKSMRSFTVFPDGGVKANFAVPESLLDLSLYEIPNGNVLPAHSVILSESDKIHIPVKRREDKKSRFQNISFLRLLRQKDVCMSVILYAVFAFGVIGYEEIYTVWTSTEQYLGGLDFSTQDIGKAIGVGAAPLLIINVILFPVLEQRIGAKRVFVIFCVVLIVTTILTPCIRYLPPGSGALWAVVLTASVVFRVSASMCFASVSFFVNNSSRPEDVGKVNGIGMVFTGVGRFLAPLVCGSIFAWSVTHGVRIGFPLDVNFTFIVLGASFLGSNILVATMPNSVDKQKKHDQNN